MYGGFRRKLKGVQVEILINIQNPLYRNLGSTTVPKPICRNWATKRVGSHPRVSSKSHSLPRVNMSNVLCCSGWCAMYMNSPCYGCGRSVRPTRILPPNKNEDRNQSRRRNIHSCGAPDCPGRDHYRGPLPFGPVGKSLLNGIQRFNFKFIHRNRYKSYM